MGKKQGGKEMSLQCRMEPRNLISTVLAFGTNQIPNWHHDILYPMHGCVSCLNPQINLVLICIAFRTPFVELPHSILVTLECWNLSLAL